MATTPEGTIRVARSGARGWHVIARAKYEANPAAFTVIGDDGRPVGSANALDGMTVAELRAFAASHGIDLGDATKKDDIRAAIDLASE